MKRAVLLLLTLVMTSGPAPAVIDPFYRTRMESGIRAFEQGNWEVAAHQLRIACFGHLDEPPTLAAGLVRLAIVEARRENEEAFRRIFSRLAELEERFSAYSRARFPGAVRQQFEGLAARLVPVETLRTAAGFHSIAERADIQLLTAMPPAPRRTELQARLQAEPERADWLTEMAKLELEVRRPQTALDWLDRLPAAEADMPPATCLRQQAASEAGDCSRMDLVYPFCRSVPPLVVEFRLECLVEAERWTEASRLLGGMDDDLRARRRIARLERRVRNNTEETEPLGGPASGTAVVTVPPDEPAEAAAPETMPAAEPPLSPPPVDQQELDLLRRRLASAATSDELAALMVDAEGFAERHPEARQPRLLAAEIAYLQSDWQAAVHHFSLAGRLRFDEAHLAFYQAVALYESGDPTTAAEVLRSVLQRLERTSFVDSYVERILAPGI